MIKFIAKYDIQFMCAIWFLAWFFGTAIACLQGV